MFAPRLGHLFHVRLKVALPHVPVIVVVADHGVVFGEPNFREAESHRLRGQLDRLARGVTTERRVHVIIGGQRHATHPRPAGASAARRFEPKPLETIARHSLRSPTEQRPMPAKPKLIGNDPKYERWRWQIFSITWLAYAGIYLTRKAFSIAKNELKRPEILGLSTGQMSVMDGANSAAYALG